MLLNGKNVEIKKGITVDRLLEEYKINSFRVVVEVNREIVDKADFGKIKLKNDDLVEVISFVGGG